MLVGDLNTQGVTKPTVWGNPCQLKEKFQIPPTSIPIIHLGRSALDVTMSFWKNLIVCILPTKSFLRIKINLFYQFYLGGETIIRTTMKPEPTILEI